MSTNKKTKINPVCLPESSFPDENQVGFVIGLGLMFQQTCRTNGGGPEMYKQCAPGKGRVLFRKPPFFNGRVH